MRRFSAVVMLAMIVSGCNGDMQLIASKAWSEMTTTPIGTVSTRWATMHPRNIDLEMELEFLNYSLNHGPRTYGSMVYEQIKSKEELDSLLAEWRNAPCQVACCKTNCGPS